MDEPGHLSGMRCQSKQVAGTSSEEYPVLTAILFSGDGRSRVAIDRCFQGMFFHHMVVN